MIDQNLQERIKKSKHYKYLPGMFESLPAFKGCLLQLVRDAWESPEIIVSPSSTRRKSDNLLAWQAENVRLSEQGAKKIGASRGGSVNCWGYESELDALLCLIDQAPS
jgi:hypothetical protein